MIHDVQPPTPSQWTGRSIFLLGFTLATVAIVALLGYLFFIRYSDLAGSWDANLPIWGPTCGLRFRERNLARASLGKQLKGLADSRALWGRSYRRAIARLPASDEQWLNCRPFEGRVSHRRGGLHLLM